MNVEEFIEEIESDDKLATYLNHIPAKNKKTQIDFMHAMNRLSYILYLSDNSILANHIIHKMIKVDFIGDYRYWEPVQNVALLATYMTSKDYLDQVKKMIVKAQSYGDEISVLGKLKVHKRFLTGTRLEALQLELKQTQDEVMQINRRIILLFHLFYLNIFSDESSLDKQIIEQEMEHNLLIIRKYIYQHGVNNLYPYK